MFLQIDGIDGSGKSTLLNAARAWAEERGLRVIDTVAWSKENGRHPTLEDVGDADVLLTAEPTHAGIGKEIREEIIRTNTPYNARFAAEAFSRSRSAIYASHSSISSSERRTHRNPRSRPPVIARLPTATKRDGWGVNRELIFRGFCR